MEEKSGERGRDVLRLLAAMSPADRAVYAVVGLLLLGAILLPPLLALDPRVAVTLAFGDGKQARDPWGNPFLSIVDSEAPEGVTARRLVGFGGSQTLMDAFFAYSSGPNGRDERGGGDDVFLLEEGDPRLVLAGPGSPVVMLGLAVLLAGTWELFRLLRRQLGAREWAGPGVEAARAAGIGLPAGGIAAVLALVAPRIAGSLQPLIDSIDRALLVPFPLAIGGGAWLVVTLVVLWQRSRTVGRDAGESRPPGEEGPKPI